MLIQEISWYEIFAGFNLFLCTFQRNTITKSYYSWNILHIRALQAVSRSREIEKAQKHVSLWFWYFLPLLQPVCSVQLLPHIACVVGDPKANFFFFLNSKQIVTNPPNLASKASCHIRNYFNCRLFKLMILFQAGDSYKYFCLGTYSPLWLWSKSCPGEQ